MSNIAAPKAQGAMEYLATYGWAILIIIIVAAVLFELGLFGGGTGPRARAGSCQVYRPGGPGSADGIGLSGICTAELPLFVASLSGNDFIETGDNLSQIGGSNDLSITGWGLLTATPKNLRDDLISIRNGNNCGGVIAVTSQDAVMGSVDGVANSLATGPANQISLNRWYFLTMTFNGVSINVYVDGVLEGTGPTLVNHIDSCSGPTAIGADSNLFQFFWQGDISNVQVYTDYLNTDQINAMYLNGIGGPPTDLANLVAWWPLNQNANDYSGNLFNANIISTSYTTSYTSGYTTP